MRMQMVDENSMSIQYADPSMNVRWVGNELQTGSVVPDDIPDNKNGNTRRKRVWVLHWNRRSKPLCR